MLVQPGTPPPRPASFALARCIVGHLDAMATHVARIVSDGVAQGVYHTTDPRATARAILAATARFHAPAHAAEWTSPSTYAAFNDVWVFFDPSGLKAAPARSGRPYAAGGRSGFSRAICFASGECTAS